jgi:hypothetical protein
MKNQKYLLTFAAIVIFVLLIWLASKQSVQDTQKPLTGGNILITESSLHDFGSISMSRGIVSKTFQVKNPLNQPVLLAKLYTSCMCTEATLVKSDGKRLGPFGMPGHGGRSTGILSEEILPNETFEVLVTFDPAAHGPAGVGQTVREVYLEGINARLLTLRIGANVTP